MHDETAGGNEFFKCDFCRRAWAEDRPMVEGHQGSLICGACLSVAYAEVVRHGAGTPAGPGVKCAMCLEERDGAHWQSPAYPASWVCLRCIKQSARVLLKDAESGWAVPG